ncbi:hypothetical protein PV08_02905 [Exophiala spinifera]|uniref:Uncharacterized protein n=1 Tax=Exophiala spinifera TaxID=91928 RepID=A0A0D1YTP8_9EURO|nr:uncharacterized protein PV08_02905 [Exophiala spinifera]KIW18616.1 hypothetical protein PV08_02905 [Exophiala spinifera]
MGRKKSRKAQAQDDESDEGPAPSEMSPNTRKEYDKMQIMTADLSLATADHIKTSDYRRPTKANVELLRLCDDEGSAEAKIAAKNKKQTSQWLNWGTSDEARKTAHGERVIGTGNTHRAGLAHSLAETERRAGRPLTLNDTYDDRGSTKRFKHGASTNAAKSTISGQQDQLPSPARKTTEASGSKKRDRTRPFQNRPWPPPALEGSPFLSGSGQSMSFGVIPTPQHPRTNVGNASQIGAANAHTRRPQSATIPSSRLSARPRSAVPLADASTFMSLATNIIASRSQSKSEKSSAGAVSSGSAAPIMETQAKTEQEDKESVADFGHDEPGIRKVPIAEFSFSASAALAGTQLSTHTDGAPSSTVLSSISPSVGSEQPVKDTNIFEASKALVGLGISGASLGNITSTKPNVPPSPLPTGVSSENRSLLDSPIPEDMGSAVLVASKRREKGVVVIDGVRYIPESRLLALEESIKKGETSLHDYPREPQAHDEAALIKSKLQTPTLMVPSYEPASTVTKVSTKAVNPFQPRDPAPEGTSDQVVAQAAVSRPLQVPQGPPRTLDEALVAAVNSPLNAMGIQAPAKPSAKAKAKATKHAIVSKWAAPPGEDYEPHPMAKDISQMDPVASETSDISSQVKQPVLQSKSTNGGRSGKKVKNPFEAKLTGLESGPGSPVGEEVATDALRDQQNPVKPFQFAAAASRPPSKRQYATPGPGYALLLAALEQKTSSHPNSVAEDGSEEEEL